MQNLIVVPNEYEVINIKKTHIKIFPSRRKINLHQHKSQYYIKRLINLSIPSIIFDHDQPYLIIIIRYG